jgi:hypothetical protein
LSVVETSPMIRAWCLFVKRVRMRLSPLTLVIGIIVAVVGVVIVTAALIPQQTNPAYDIGVQFVNAASKGDDEAALAALSQDLQAYVGTNCSDGRVSACISSYAPPEWGAFQSAVFRRAQPEGTNVWHVQYVSTYEKDRGASGVCIYTRLEKAGETWQVTRWSGWVWCGDAQSGLSELMKPDAIHHAP